MTEQNYLILKCGLYYKPNASGYTGLKREAGRYNLDEVAERFPNKDSENQDGMEYIAEEDAPVFSPSCCKNVMLDEIKREYYAMMEKWGKLEQLIEDLEITSMSLNHCGSIDYHRGFDYVLEEIKEFIEGVNVNVSKSG